MARIFITGSADGLGLLSATSLIDQGHQVVLHARNAQRGEETVARMPHAAAILTANLAISEETKRLAEALNSFGAFDAVIHNAGVYDAPASQLLAVNLLAPYLLTSLMRQPTRLIYLSSGMHLQGRAKLDGIKDHVNSITYADTKLHVLMLCKAVSRRWPDVRANTVDPGWVPTKMGGSHATGDLRKGYETQVWLATSHDEQTQVSGRYFFHQRESRYHSEADDPRLQDALLRFCQELTGIPFPQ